MSNNGPRDEVFTTVLVNEAGEVADWDAHQQRLEDHANRLRITLPNEPPALKPTLPNWNLARISFSKNGISWNVEHRKMGFRNEAIDAITHPAPRWNERTNGCKHGDWAPYNEAKKAADQAGCDAALLVHDHCIVDADRATPMVLDEDGTVWMASDTEGGVSSITAKVLERHLPNLGFPVVKGKLNERTVARCAEFILVGTGMGVCRVDSLDGEPLGQTTVLSQRCQELLHEHFTEKATWSRPG